MNGGEDSFWKQKDFQLSRTRDLDLRSGHTANHRASLIDLYLHAKVRWNQINFYWTDGSTNKQTFDTHFIMPTEKSRPNNCSALLVAAPQVITDSRPRLLNAAARVLSRTNNTTKVCCDSSTSNYIGLMLLTASSTSSVSQCYNSCVVKYHQTWRSVVIKSPTLQHTSIYVPLTVSYLTYLTTIWYGIVGFNVPLDTL